MGGRRPVRRVSGDTGRMTSASGSNGPEIVLIAALAENRVIGRDGDLPWQLPDDLARFKKVTLGHCVIMGRRTFDSVGRPLPNRRSIVISRDPDLHIDGVEVAGSLDAALEMAGDVERLFILGGGQIYRLALPRADRLDLTMIHAEVDGDTTFPEIADESWRLIHDERHEIDDRHAVAFSFRQYSRV